MAEYVEQLLDNYRLTRFLGEGGFGKVYLGEHVYHKTLVAIKVLPPLDQDDLPNFLNEARTVRLNHANIVRMLDFGVENDTPFLVMEYAPNGSLRQRHARGTRLALPTIISYVKQIAGGLQYAHDERLIHRDVKPENMLVGANNQLLLSDFGAALVARSSFFRRTQNIVGTATYMAPEQLEGKPCFASDQYALGIVIYEWLCGTAPFHGNFFELYQYHRHIPPPSLRAGDPSLSPYVEQVVMKALTKEAEQRFSSVREFADALEQAGQATPRQLFLPPVPTFQAYSQTEQMPVPQAFPPTVYMPSAVQIPARRTMSRRNFVGGAIVIGAALVAGGGWYLARGIASGPQGPATGTLLMTHRQQNEIFTCAWSSNDTYIASAGGDQYSRAGDTNVYVWESQTGNITHTFKGHTQVVRSMDWSPVANDHRLVSGSEDGTVWVWDIDTGAGNQLYTATQGLVLSVAWSPGGDRIAVGGSDTFVRVLDAARGTILGSYRHGDAVYAVSWSPDGKRIASASVDMTMKIWDASSGQIITEQANAIVGAVAWSPDSTYIASGEYNDRSSVVHSDSDAIQLWDANGRHILTYPGSADGHQIYSLGWSPDSKYVVSGGQDTQVNIWKALTGTNTYSYMGHSSYKGPQGERGYVMAARWSHSGLYIASCGFDKTVQVWAASQDSL